MTSIKRTVIIDGQAIQADVRNPAISASPRCVHTGNNPAATSSDGNDTTPSITETYLAECHVPDSMATVTGIALFNGSAVAGNVTLMLFDAAGYLIAKTASTAQANTDTYQLVPFTAAVSLVPGTYYVAATFSNTGARFNSHLFGTFGAGKLTSQVYGTMPAGTIACPTTFTANLGPIASLY